MSIGKVINHCIRSRATGIRHESCRLCGWAASESVRSKVSDVL